MGQGRFSFSFANNYSIKASLNAHLQSFGEYFAKRFISALPPSQGDRYYSAYSIYSIYSIYNHFNSYPFYGIYREAIRREIGVKKIESQVI